MLEFITKIVFKSPRLNQTANDMANNSTKLKLIG